MTSSGTFVASSCRGTTRRLFRFPMSSVTVNTQRSVYPYRNLSRTPRKTHRVCRCRTRRGILIQHPPIPVSNSKFVLIFFPLLDFNFLVVSVFVMLVDCVLHLLKMPCWLGEGTSEVDGWYGPRPRILDRHRNLLRCHGGAILWGGYAARTWLCFDVGQSRYSGRGITQSAGCCAPPVRKEPVTSSKLPNDLVAS